MMRAHERGSIMFARRVVICVVVVGGLALAACAPEFNPLPGYAGGYLMNTDRSRTVTVAPGDTLYAISQRYDVPTKVIAERNGLMPPHTLTTGQILILDPTRIHRVRGGDTVATVARRYDVDETVLASANELARPYRLRPGQDLWIPDPITNASATSPAAGGISASSAAVPPQRPVVSETLPPPIAAVAAPEPVVAVALPSRTLAKPAPRAGSRFAWPVTGKVVAGFGPVGKGLHNDGINIAAPAGAQVRAAENGVVAYAGNELRGFGNLLLLKHADGWTTAYAHNKKLLVKRGDRVTQGQVIATVGRTGNVDSVQLHFEVRKGTQALDPIKYLAQADG